MSGRARMLLADGRWSTARKTLARRIVVPKEDRPDTRLLILLPDTMSLYSPGPTGVAGVTIEPGPMVVAAGKDVEWVYGQLAAWLQANKFWQYAEAILTATHERGEERRGQTVCIQPDGVIEFPRGARKPLRFER